MPRTNDIARAAVRLLSAETRAGFSVPGHFIGFAPKSAPVTAISGR